MRRLFRMVVMFIMCFEITGFFGMVVKSFMR
jgi:hypothetical protein